MSKQFVLGWDCVFKGFFMCFSHFLVIFHAHQQMYINANAFGGRLYTVGRFSVNYIFILILSLLFSVGLLAFLMLLVAILDEMHGCHISWCSFNTESRCLFSYIAPYDRLWLVVILKQFKWLLLLVDFPISCWNLLYVYGTSAALSVTYSSFPLSPTLTKNTIIVHVCSLLLLDIF